MSEFKRGALLLEYPVHDSPSSDRWIRIYEGSDKERVVVAHEYLAEDETWQGTRSELVLNRRELVQLGKALIELHRRVYGRHPHQRKDPPA